ncbi:hypothetical protein [Treponema phagedenis]|uniref:hypothetical protein n=1 Tax=Treponema phagedenis TaxID=162 RepID=UPI0011E87FF9|nr:hypothetical protein [Treponema phagedenis]QEK05781.1 hypothetical protein FUT80_02965 [Treponema phagedenis]
MKKHAKIIGMGMMLVLAAVLVTGCPTPNKSGSGTSGSGSSSSGGSGGSGGNPSPKPTEAVQKTYDAALEELAAHLKDSGATADEVVAGFRHVNMGLSQFGWKVVDNNPGTDLAQGTTVEQLKERFTLEKVAAPNPGPGSQPPEVVQMQYDDVMQRLADGLKRSDLPADEVVAGFRHVNMGLSQFGWKVVDNNPGTDLAQGTTVEQLKERFTLEKVAAPNPGPGSQPPEVVQMQYDDVMQRLADGLKRSDLPADEVVAGFRHVNMGLSQFGWKVVDNNPGTDLAQGTTVEQLKERFTLQKITE